jgi:MFS family permease
MDNSLPDPCAAPPVPRGDCFQAQAVTLACTLAIQVVATASTLAFAVLAPAIPDVQPSAVGVFLAVVYLGAMVSSVLGGPVVNALGPVRASQAALLLQAVALALLTIGTPATRMAAALLCGLGYGPVTPASSQILARTTTPERMGVVFSLKQTGVPLGGLLGGAILPVLATAFSWRAGLAGLAVLAVLVAVASNRLRAELDDGATGRLAVASGWHRPIAEVLVHPPLRSLAGVSLLFSACQLSVSGYMMVFLHREIGMGLAQAGLVYAFAQGAGMAGRVLWGQLADATGSPRGVLIGISALMAASAVGTSLFTAHWPVVALCGVAAVFGATAIGWNGVYLGEVARLAPPGRVASVTGGALFFTYFGVVVGPPGFGYLAERIDSLGLAYGVLAVLPMIALVLLVLLRGRGARQ